MAPRRFQPRLPKWTIAGALLCWLPALHALHEIERLRAEARDVEASPWLEGTVEVHVRWVSDDRLVFHLGDGFFGAEAHFPKGLRAQFGEGEQVTVQLWHNMAVAARDYQGRELQLVGHPGLSARELEWALLALGVVGLLFLLVGALLES